MDDRAARRDEVTDPGGLRAFRELGVIERGLADPGEIALHIRQEHRHTALREAFGQDPDRDGLTGAGGAGDEPMAIGHGE